MLEQFLGVVVQAMPAFIMAVCKWGIYCEIFDFKKVVRVGGKDY